MQYYLVDDSADGNQIRAYSVINALGQPVCDIAPGELQRVERAVATAVEKRRPSDKAFSMAKDFLVSARAREHFLTLNMGDHIIWVPTELQINNQPGCQYYLIRSKRQYDVLDRPRCKFNYFRTDPTAVRSVKTYAFRKDRLPAEDLFLTTEDDWRWIATDRLVQAVSAAHLTGFKFVPIWSSN